MTRLTNSRRDLFLAGVLLLLALVVYWPALRGEFLWDDDVLLVESPLLQSWAGLRDIWFSSRPADYFPLWLSALWVQKRLWGLEPLGYHLVNLAFHGLNGMLLWRVLRRLNVPGALLAAALFLVHPVCVASVAWISELKNTLSLFWCLLSIRSFLCWQTGQKPAPYALALVFFGCAVLSKTSAVVLAPISVLLLWHRSQKFTKAAVARLAPFFLLALALGAVGLWFQSHRSLAQFAASTGPLGARVAAGGWALWFYAGKLLAPTGLCMLYPKWDLAGAGLWAVLPGVGWLAALLVCWRYRRTWGRPFVTGLGYFTLALFPALGWVNLSWFVFSWVSDHLQYLAAPGFLALLAFLGYRLTSRLKPGFRAVVGCVPVLLLGCLGWQRAAVFANAERLWAETVQRNPHSWAAQYNLGVALQGRQELAGALEHYQAALADNPDHAAARYNLANLLAQTGQLQPAIEQYRELLRRHPEHTLGENNLGFVLLLAGRVDEAVTHFQHVLANNPQDANAHLNLGRAFLARQDLAGAQKEFALALQLDPSKGQVIQQLLPLPESPPPAPTNTPRQ